MNKDNAGFQAPQQCVAAASLACRRCCILPNAASSLALQANSDVFAYVWHVPCPCIEQVFIGADADSTGSFDVVGYDSIESASDEADSQDEADDYDDQ